MDGAGPVQIFFRITLPLLRPVILFTLVVSTVTGLQSFTEPAGALRQHAAINPTSGGPGQAGLTMVLYFYQQAFDNNDYGYGAAIAWAVFLVVVLFSIINWRLVQRRERGRTWTAARRGRQAGHGAWPLHLPSCSLGVAVSVFPFYWIDRHGDATPRSDIYSHPPKLRLRLPTAATNIRHVLRHDRLLRVDGQHGDRRGARTTFLVLFFDSLAAFAFAKFDFPGSRCSSAAAGRSSCCPPSWPAIPQFVIMAQLGWVGSSRR